MERKFEWYLIALVFLGCIMIGWGLFTELSGGNELAMDYAVEAWTFIGVIGLIPPFTYLIYKNKPGN